MENNNNFSLESVKDNLFGVKVEDKFSIALEGYEYITEDDNQDPSYFASQEGASLAEADGIGMLADINIAQVSQESEEFISLEADDKAAKGAAVAARVKAVLSAIGQAFAKLVQAIMNFVKKIGVWIKTVLLGEQKAFYEKTVKPNEAKIMAADVMVKVALPTKSISAVIDELMKGSDARKAAVAAAYKKAETLKDSTDGAAVMEEIKTLLPSTPETSPAVRLNMALFGKAEAPAPAEVALKDLLKVVSLDFLGPKGVAEVTKLQKTGMALAKETDGIAKSINKLAVAAGKNIEDGKAVAKELTVAVSTVRSAAQNEVTLVLNAFNTATRYMSVVRSAAKTALGASKKEEKPAEPAK